MSHGQTLMTRLATKAAAAAAKQKQQIIDNASSWEIKADADMLKEVSSLSRQRDQVSLKRTRGQRTLVTAKHEVSLPQLKTFLKKVNDAYAELGAIHKKLISRMNLSDSHRGVHVSTRDEHHQGSNSTTTGDPEVIAIEGTDPYFRWIVRPSWPKFKPIFQDLMVDSGDSDVIKLYHLDKTLVGEAAGVLDVKVMSEWNYQQAWTILSERYENKRIVVETQICGLFNISKMTSGSCEELRRLHDECIRPLPGPHLVVFDGSSNEDNMGGYAEEM
ncbi:uncharacterized protein LOC134288102 [Aedes albopictus]|uniref:Uncharacterized protein n=1 Tax=Aedes albopictus TaxID=7160 RepID=A0ABM2A7N3_AEDAL